MARRTELQNGQCEFGFTAEEIEILVGEGILEVDPLLYSQLHTLVAEMSIVTQSQRELDEVLAQLERLGITITTADFLH